MMTSGEYYDEVMAIGRQMGWRIEERLTGKSKRVSNCGVCEERLGIATLPRVTGESSCGYCFTWDATGPEEIDIDCFIDALKNEIANFNPERTIGDEEDKRHLLVDLKLVLKRCRFARDCFWKERVEMQWVVFL